MTKPPSVDDILRSVAAGGLREYEITPGPHGHTVRTDGSAEDHARAMTALKAMQRAQPAPAAASLAPGPKIVAITLKEAVKKWLMFIGPTTKPKTLSVKRLSAEGFLAWKKDCPLHTVTRTDCAEFAQQLMTSGIALRTATNRMIFLGGFFKWAMASGHYPPGDNPAERHLSFGPKAKKTAAKKSGWQAFTAEQLAAIFDPANFDQAGQAHTRWAMVIAVYTGSRVGEITQLMVADFVKDGGHDCIRFTETGEGQSLKTDASERTIPIHPALVELGLLERVAMLRLAGEKRLFPSLQQTQNGWGAAVSSGFSHYLRRLKITASNGSGRVGMHSFRDTVIQAMKTANVPAELRRDYVGHDQRNDDDHDTAYGERHRASALALAIFPRLIWPFDLVALKRLLFVQNKPRTLRKKKTAEPAKKKAR